MSYVQKARLTFLGINDELKNDATSVYTTDISSSFFPIPAAVTATAATEYENQKYGVKAVTFTQRTNTNEQFMISIIIMDVKGNDELFKDSESLNKINRLIYKKL